MKKDTHPQYNNQIKVVCSSCSTEHVIGSTSEDISTEICSSCHPFYTGVERIVDTENLVAKFKERQSKAKPSFSSKKTKMETKKKKKKSSDTQANKESLTLKDMLSSLDKK